MLGCPQATVCVRGSTSSNERLSGFSRASSDRGTVLLAGVLSGDGSKEGWIAGVFMIMIELVSESVLSTGWESGVGGGGRWEVIECHRNQTLHIWGFAPPSETSPIFIITLVR